MTLTHTGNSNSRLMSNRQRLLIGGLGALTPNLLNLATLDSSVVLNVTLIVFTFYIAKVCVLFVIGSLFAYFHSEERSPLKVFELGIVAPALITAAINGGIANQAPPSGDNGSHPAAFLALITSVHADTGGQEAKRLEPPSETVSEQIWRGLTGAKSHRVYYVRIDKERSQEKAQNKAESVNQQFPNFKAEVYLVDDDEYEVVIGMHLDHEQARQLKKKAKEAHVPGDPDVKRVPER